MGQRDIYEFLKNNHENWYNSQELSELLGLGVNTIINNLKRMRNSKDIIFEERRDGLDVKTYTGNDLRMKKHRFYYKYGGEI